MTFSFINTSSLGNQKKPKACPCMQAEIAEAETGLFDVK